MKFNLNVFEIISKIENKNINAGIAKKMCKIN